MRPIMTDIGLSLWRLLPANPIVIRVVQVGSKQSKHFWARTGYLLVLLFVLIATQASLSDAGDSLVARAKASTQVFEYISMLQLAMMCFLAPVFTAGAISQEKDSETFNVLLATPLTNAQIVLGSLASRLFFVIMLLLSGLPVFCITMLFGGVTAEHIFLSFGIAGCTAVLTGSIAITTSVIRVGSRGTIFSFYAGIAIFMFAGLALGMWNATYVPESIPPGSTEGMSYLAPFHPFLALFVALSKPPAPEAAAVGHYGWPLNRMLASPQTAYMVITLLASALMVVFATFFVRRGIKQGEISWWSRLWRRGKTTTANGERTRRARHVWANPVAWREAATRGNAASSRLVYYSYMIAGSAAGLCLLIAYNTGVFDSGPPSSGKAEAALDARNWLTVLVIVEFVTVLLMAVNTAATAITRERESATMELLLTTPLTSRYIIWGKLRGLVSFTIPLMAVPAITVAVFAVSDLITGQSVPVVHVGSALALPPMLLVYSAIVCMLSLQMSLKSKGSVQAVLTSVGILLVVGFGLGLCAFGAFSADQTVGALVAPLTFVTAVWMVLNPRDIDRIAAGEFQGFIIVGTMIAVTLYGAIVAAIYKTMVRDFDMIVRKQSR